MVEVNDSNKLDFESGFLCPKCGGHTNTYRHPNAKRWCEECGFVLRQEGDTHYDYKQHLGAS
jgi:ribosomal protein S27E